MMQYFAQGACQAMEDAVCLSHMLGAYPDDFAAALEKYRAQRFARTARVQLLSRAIGEHSTTPMANTPASATPSWVRRARNDYYRDLAWLYGGTGLGGIVPFRRTPGPIA